MNILDIVLALLLAFFAIRGFFRGLLMELASIIGLALGFWLANGQADLLLPLVTRAMNDPSTAYLAAFILTFLAALMTFWLLVYFLRSALNKSKLSGIDHLFGGVFGFIKGGLLGAIVLMVLIINSPGAGYLHQSTLQPYLGGVSDWLARYLPGDLQGDYLEGSSRLDRAVDGLAPRRPA